MTQKILIDNINAPRLTTDLQGVIIDMTPALKTLFGISESIHGQPVRSALVEHAAMFDRFLTMTEAYDKIVIQDQVERCFAVWMLPFEDDDGSVGRVFIFHHITNQQPLTVTREATPVVVEDREFENNLKALHEISIELTQIEALDDFYRRVVEVGRTKLGFDRLALFLADGDQSNAVGTYGTDEEGQLTDEHHIRFTPLPTGNMIRALDKRERFSLDENVELHTRLAPAGIGWNAAAVLREGTEILGWLLTDNGIHHQPVSKAQLDTLTLYCITVSAILVQKKAQAALRESEAHYRLLAENINDFIVRTNVQGTFLYVSPSCRAWGYTPEELLGQTSFALIHPDDRASAQQKFMEAAAQGLSAFSETCRFRRKDGSYIWTENQFRLIRAEGSNEIVELVNSSRDISERKQAEDALAAERTLLRIIIDTIPDTIYAKDLDCRFTLANTALQRAVGMESPDQVLGRTDHDFSPDDSWQEFLKQDQQVMKTGEPLIGHNDMVINHDRKQAWISTTKVPLRDANGTIIGLVGVGRIITEYRLAELALAEERTLLRTIIDTIPDLIYVKDLDSRFTVVNTALQRAVGMESSEQVLGKTDFDFRSDTSPQNFFDQEQQLMKTGEPLIGQKDMVMTPDRKPEWLSTTKVPLRDVNGTIVGLVGVGRIITEHRLAELALAEERNLMRTLIDAIPDHIYVKDRNSRFILVNTATQDAFNVESSDEMLGKTDYDFMDAESALGFFNEEQRIITLGEPLLDHEDSISDEKYGTKWISTTKVPLRDANGTIIGLVGVGRKITERKLAEIALAEERNLMRTLIDAIPSFVFAKDRDSRFTLANTAIMRAFRAESFEQMVGKTDFDFLPQARAELYLAQDQQLMHDGVPMIHYEEQVNNPGYGLQWLSCTKVSLRNISGEVIGFVGVFHDITENKHVEEALRNQHHLLQSVIDHLPDFVYAKDLHGNHILNNLAHAASVGLTPAEMIGKTDFDLFPLEMAAKFFRDDMQVCETGKSIRNHEELSLNVDGNVVWVLTNKVPFRDSKGTIIGLIGQTSDFTERKLAELVLKRERDFSNAIFNNTSALMIVLDKDGHIIRFNHTCEVLTGYSAQEVEGRLFYDLFAVPGEEDLRRDGFNELFAEPVSRRFTNHWRLRDGTQRLIEFQHSHLLDEHGAVTYVVSSGIDMTEKKQAEEQARAQEKRFQALIEHSSDIFGLIDAQNVMHYQNSAITKVLGYRLEERMNVTGYEWIHPDDVTTVAKLFRDVLRAPNASGYREFRVKHKDDSYRWCEGTVSNLLHEPSVQALVVNYRDITDRKLAEKQAAELTAERAQVKILTDFVRDISHDFRTPLSLINTSAYLLGRVQDPEKRKTHLEKVEMGSSTLAKLLDRLLLMARFDGGISLRRSAANVNLLIRQIYEDVEAKARLRNVTIVPQLGENLPLISLDAQEFAQALKEVIDNAVMYTAEGGTITLRTERREHSLVISVQDTGIGIAEADLPYIFERLYRADKARTGLTGHSGLGLSIAKKIVELHGGMITVQSQLGDGSLFEIHVPVDN